MKLTGAPHESDFKALGLFEYPEQTLFLDIGANRGEASLSMLLKGPANSRVMAFEPNPLIFEKLRNRYRNEARVKVYNLGMGNQADSFTLYIPFYRKWMFDGLSSFIEEEAKGWLRTRFWRYREALLSTREVSCRVERLDNLQLEPDFIKIDVQGFEKQVLEGGWESLKKYKPVLLVETPNDEQIEMLEGLGYDTLTYSNDKLQHGTGWLNTFFVHPDNQRIRIKEGYLVSDKIKSSSQNQDGPQGPIKGDAQDKDQTPQKSTDRSKAGLTD